MTGYLLDVGLSIFRQTQCNGTQLCRHLQTVDSSENRRLLFW